MFSSLKAWVCALALIEVLFVFTAMGQGTSSDSCTKAVKSFDKRLRNVEADVKAIARALNVGNPPGKNCALLFDHFLLLSSQLLVLLFTAEL